MLKRERGFIVLFLLVVIGLIYFWKQNNPPAPAKSNIIETTGKIKNTDSLISPQASSPTPTPTGEAAAQTDTNSNPTTPPSGPPSATLSCQNEIPPDNSNQGTAKITSSWNNLTLGKSGAAKVELCVSVGGKSSLMTIDNTSNGTRSTEVNWIILNTEYHFSVYDEQGGDMPDCGGPVLATCEIDSLVQGPPKQVSR
ncbi:MAG TPA: hypothetical protein VG965_06940 [Patescibacteria group bacterium]|nr:hypothetical protein [Patescibacteria group bacterium]